MAISTTYGGAFIDGEEHRNSGDALPVTNPADGQVFAEVAGGTENDVDTRRAVCATGVRRVVRARRLQARRDPRPGRSPRRAAPRRADPAAHPRAGQDAARRPHRGDQGGRHADALRRALQGAARRAHAEPRSRRRRHRAAPAARCRGRDRALELPDDAAVQQAGPGAGGGQHRRRQAGRHDAADHPSLRGAPARGRAAGRRVQRRHRRRLEGRQRARHPSGRAQDRLHRLDAGRRADHGAVRQGHQARHARARRLGPDDHLRRRRPRRAPRARRAWAATTTAARRAWRSSASTCSSRSPTRSSRRSPPRPSG